MKTHQYFLYACLVASATCYLVAPPTTAANDTISDCSNWVVVNATSNCAAIAQNYSITLQQFEVTYVCAKPMEIEATY